MAEEDVPEDSATMAEASAEALAEEKEYMTHPRYWRQRRRWRRLNDGPKEYLTTVEASVEEDEHEDYIMTTEG